jgi:hypothetical protein
MLTRSSLLSLFLLVTIGLVTTKIYSLWSSGPWDLPTPRKAKSPIGVEDGKVVSNSQSTIGTDIIVSKNIFDPERGAGLTREAETNSQSFQRVRSMILLGTAILGNNRFAILQDGAASPGPAAAPGQSVGPMRIKLGDTVEGFRLSEISEKRVVFARGSATVELPLDYFRKVDIAQPQARRAAAPQTTPAAQAATPGSATPRVVTPPANVPAQRMPRPVPALPRRERQPNSAELEGH